MKKTKIVATISDLNCDVSFLSSLFENGVNVVRINTAHATFEGAKKIIENTRKVSSQIGILIDTKGPEIRTCPMQEPIPVEYGDTLKMSGDPDKESTPEKIYVNYKNFVADVPVNSKVLIDDGSLALQVTSKNNDELTCMVLNSGQLKGKKSVNIPSAHIKLPALSKKDIEFINFAVDNQVDFIAHSFVRNKEDVIAVKGIIESRGGDIGIIAKIENEEGVHNIEEILDYSYGVMVARGDLAVEIPTERLPIVQKRIVDIAIKKCKPVIIATQMLHSMISSPSPTRAEVNDIANAVLDRTDAVMLSGETAFGKYPLESVQMMTRICKEVEGHGDFYKRELAQADSILAYKDKLTNKIINQLTKLAINAANDLQASAVIADTISGSTIRKLASFRSDTPIFAQCYNAFAMRLLSLTYGAQLNYIEKGSSFIEEAIKSLKKTTKIHPKQTVILIAGHKGNGHTPSYVQISTIEDLNSNKNK